ALVAEAPYQEPADQRFNDGRCDRQGRLVVGTMFEPRSRAGGALYRLRGNRLEKLSLAGDLTISNALAWSPDGTTMYHADTPTQQVYAYSYDVKTGAL